MIEKCLHPKSCQLPINMIKFMICLEKSLQIHNLRCYALLLDKIRMETHKAFGIWGYPIYLFALRFH